MNFKPVRFGVLAVLLIVAAFSRATDPDPANEHIFQAPLAPIYLSGGFPITITTEVDGVSTTVTGTLVSAQDGKGVLGGFLRLNGRNFAMKGKYKSATSAKGTATTIGVSAVDGVDKITLKGKVEGNSIVGLSTGKGAVAK